MWGSQIRGVIGASRMVGGGGGQWPPMANILLHWKNWTIFISIFITLLAPPLPLPRFSWKYVPESNIFDFRKHVRRLSQVSKNGLCVWQCGCRNFIIVSIVFLQATSTLWYRQSTVSWVLLYCCKLLARYVTYSHCFYCFAASY